METLPEQDISIHAPVKGAASCPRKGSQISKHFNPRPREGGGVDYGHDRVVCHISIHAPVKGAATGRVEYPHTPRISIHAPVKGAAISRLLLVDMPALFQSTPP